VLKTKVDVKMAVKSRLTLHMPNPPDPVRRLIGEHRAAKSEALKVTARREFRKT
jgi:hypothetical protein